LISFSKTWSFSSHLRTNSLVSSVLVSSWVWPYWSKSTLNFGNVASYCSWWRSANSSGLTPSSAALTAMGVPCMSLPET